ncbi:MAG: non-heme iron oxygenase ferredoxin subunit [Verrucomicrobiota bacterium]
MAKLVKVAETKDLASGQAGAFEVEGRRIAVFNVDGNYFAIDDTCPHAGAPLSEGSVSGGKVVCPWHEAEFDLNSGAVLGPPADQGVGCYKVVVEGNDIKVEI